MSEAVAATAPALIPLKGLRGSIARNMSAGWQAPRVAMAVDVDMTACQALQACVAEQGTKLTPTALVVRAAALALRRHPAMNALMREGGIERAPDVHVGLAVAVDGGLAVPVLREADTKSATQLAAEARELAAAARAGQLPPRAYQGGTFTVTSLGMTGIDWFTPILNPPQVGILGVSRVIERAVVRGATVVPAPMTTLSLIFDHRAIDGHPAALFLRELADLLEQAREL
ncbi:2-oxo acid dehydrogenase subunit E2 [Azohydromonas lata]|uniref:2-oxo acid dehydrogenase subunit E2 n=1 Tax=Azohydromonas lata TaxID=45677 RepID=A0ABU5ID40_9BURK|nr:2-oxo acid dehydrogenase subunit E2 [Azohydromonas lata]MDZ5456877.1 2-oxo acid dehydrogenase subunit E2 [Azohydromonas lata]